MKVFFSASRQGRQYFDIYYGRISSFLKKEGYENINKELMTKDSGLFNKKLKTLGIKANNLFYKSMLDKVHHADICIFECSFQSLTIGFLIEKALEQNKPVIAVYLEDHQPSFLTGLKDEKFQLIEYNKKNLIDLLKDGIKKADLMTDKRFNFFISPTLLTYLNKVSKQLGITKSTFIRNLIEEHIKHNK